MQEIEVKAKVNNLEEIKKKLTTLGCAFSESVIQKDKIFFKQGITLHNIPKDNVVLRIRDENDKHTLTLKRKLGQNLANIEKEVTISDPKQAQGIIEHMNFYHVDSVEKQRQTGTYKDYNICLDDVKDLGTFIELETILPKQNNDKDSKTITQIQEDMFSFLQTLGITKEQRITKGFDIMLDKKK